MDKVKKLITAALAALIMTCAATGLFPGISVEDARAGLYTVQAAGEDSGEEDSAGKEISTETVTEVGDLDVSMDPSGKLTTTWDEKSDSTSTWNTIFKKYKVVITGFTGIATLTFLILFIVQLVRLSAAANNPTERSKALQGILWIGIALAGSGSATLICALAWNALKD